MESIFNINNLNTFIGRYSRRKKVLSTEQKTGWLAYGLLHEKLPVLAIRNREADDQWPLSWRPGRNMQLAIIVTLESLKAWQAYRPKNSDPMICRLSEPLVGIILKFQTKMRKSGIYSIREADPKNESAYSDALISCARSVGKVSAFKTIQVPMLGSKILHFMLPEFFPVWDTAWIKNRALANEDMSEKALGKWLPRKVIREFEKNKYDYDAASFSYASYLALMLKHYHATPKAVYKNIEQTYIRHSEVDEAVIRWHICDTVPMLFEICLLGKYDRI